MLARKLAEIVTGPGPAVESGRQRATYIFDADALPRLAKMEGDAWQRVQEANPESPYGFYAWARAWEARQALIQTNPDYGDEPVASFLEGGDGAIYGAGGWRRYAVAMDGEIVLMRWSATEEACARAEALGLRVSGGTV